MFKLVLEKAEKPEMKLPTSTGSWKKQVEFQKNIYFCFIDYAKAFDCVDHNKLGKILKEMGIPDHLTCLLGNLYTGQEATVRTGHGTTDWFQIGKGVCQGCILSPCLCKVVRCQFKKRHHTQLLSKVFTDLAKVFPLKWICPPPEVFHWWRREHSTDPAVRLIVKCCIGVSPGQEGIVLRIKWKTQDCWSQQK